MPVCRRSPLLICLACLVAFGTIRAENLGSQLKKAMKEKAKGTYYLKTNVPYFQGRHAYGTFKKPLVTVTPSEGPKIAASADVQGGVFHAEARRLALRVNDPVKTDDIDWDSDDQTLEIELEGTGRAKDAEGVLKFAGMQSLADFEKCWEQTFSDVSIEQKYDWPEDIKKAVVERKVLPGMTPEQVMVAVGNPEKITQGEEDGKKVEIWTIQRGEGGKMGFWTMKTGDKQEIEIAFADGKVVRIGGEEEAQPGIKLK